MRSKFESSFAAWMDKEGIKYSYEPKKPTLWWQEKIHGAYCTNCGTVSYIFKERLYIPDFVIRKTIIETKGKFTSRDRKKMLSICNTYDKRFGKGRYRIVLVFQYDNWLTTKHKSRYSDWCDKYGIEYYIAKEPKKVLKLLRSIK